MQLCTLSPKGLCTPVLSGHIDVVPRPLFQQHCTPKGLPLPSHAKIPRLTCPQIHALLAARDQSSTEIKQLPPFLPFPQIHALLAARDQSSTEIKQLASTVSAYRLSHHIIVCCHSHVCTYPHISIHTYSPL